MAGQTYSPDLVRGSPNNHYESEDKLRYELDKTVTLTPELYELGVLGFTVAVTPLACAFMGWQGSGGLGIATGTVGIFFGGMLLIFAGIGEFLLGNTFPMVVFFGYGARFFAYSTTFVPAVNAIGFFNPDGSGIGSPGAANQTSIFLASYGFYLIAMCLLSFIFLLDSSRVNVVFVIIVAFATIGFGLGSGAFFHLLRGNVVIGTKLATGTGACFFAAGVLGFYFLLALIIAIMELPIPDLPVFDLSTVIKPRARGMIKEE